MQEEILTKSIYPAIDEFMATSTQEYKLEKRPDTPLFGSCRTLDSLAFVSFVVVVEQLVEENFGKPIRVMSEKAMSRSQSPFQSLGTLASYVEELLEKGSD